MASMAMASLVATLLAAAVTNVQQFDATRSVEQSADVKLELGEARLALRDVEASPDAVAPTRALALRLDTLRRMTSDDDRQRARVIAASEALDRSRSASERAGLDVVRSALVEMRIVEDTVASQRAVDRSRARARAAAALASIALVTMVLSAWALLLITRQHRLMAAQAAIQESILESMGEAVVATNAEREVLVVNAAARRLFSHVQVGKPLPRVLPSSHVSKTPEGRTLRTSQAPLSRALDGVAIDHQVFSLSAPGAPEIWVNGTGRPVRDGSGAVLGGVAIFRDVTQQKREADTLAALSVTDELTGLANRRAFTMLAEKRLAAAHLGGTPFAILFADLNGLKSINDTLGHDSGDRAIRDAARVFQSSVRQTDTVARLGGDEFVVLVDNASPASIAAIEKRMRRSIEDENRRNGGGYRLSISTGVAVFDASAPQTVEALLCEADERMYANKLARERTGSGAASMRLVAASA